MQSALIFDRDEVEEVEDWQSEVGKLRRSSILWVDVREPDGPDSDELVEALGLTRESREQLADGVQRPYLTDYDSYIQVRALAPSHQDDPGSLARVDCLVSPSWVVTVHDGPLLVLDDFRERACGSGDTGRLDGLELLANLLEWVLNSYLEAFEAVELALEEFDTHAMQGGLDETDDELGQLVALRHRVGGLRRALTSHREVLLALTRPELANINTSEHAERYAELRARLEDVVQAARDSRDSVVGSFDVVIARSEQRTNEIVKILTLASMLLLPGALIAGVLGMNFKVGLFAHAWLFWVAVGLIGAIAAVTLGAARARRWI